jgi:hypothetical protein
LALTEVYFWTLSINWCPKPKKNIIDKELKTPKRRPKYKPQNNKPEQTHTYKTQKDQNTNHRINLNEHTHTKHKTRIHKWQ